MKLLLLMIIASLTACGTFERKNGVYSKDKEFDTHIDFYLDSKLKYLGTSEVNHNISVYYYVLDKAIADCRETKVRYPDGTVRINKHIRVDRKRWSLLLFIEKRIVMIHELGHCDLDLDHGEQGTIMGPKLMNHYLYFNAEDFYLGEFFSHSED